MGISRNIWEYIFRIYVYTEYIPYHIDLGYVYIRSIYHIDDKGIFRISSIMGISRNIGNMWDI
jgi:hypothetical protein